MPVSPQRDPNSEPERRPEDGIREKLRGLFQATDAVDLEALIAERGRELEARSAQLASSIAELEKREERAQQLHVAVEQLLRRGAAELDEREAQLNQVAARLAEREAELQRLDRELAERRQELGAVELHRATVDRRDAAVAEREQAVEGTAAELEQRDRELAEREARLAAREAAFARPEALPAPEAAEQPAAGHLLFLPGERYRLVEADGPAPPIGAELEIEGVRYGVLRHGTSPLPADERRCAVLEPLAPD